MEPIHDYLLSPVSKAYVQSPVVRDYLANPPPVGTIGIPGSQAADEYMPWFNDEVLTLLAPAHDETEELGARWNPSSHRM